MNVPGTTTIVFAIVALAKVASAQSVDVTRSEPAKSLELASVGGLSPLTSSAALGPNRAVVVGMGGYDTSRSGALFDSQVEARVWGPIALRVGVTYSDDTRRMRPSIGARVQFLRQEAHGVDASLGSLFKTEGFDEAEGEIETTFALGRRFERLYLLGNVAYGQDPEGNERDGELRFSALRQQGWALCGLEARARTAIGPQHAPSSAVEPRFDAVLGPLAMIPLGSFALFAEAGPSAVKLEGMPLRWGVASIAGVGSVF